MRLHLGVLDLPYGDAPSLADRFHKAMKRGLGEGFGPVETTGDVAEILEARYHVMEHFFELHGQDIADDLAGSLKGALESAMMGAPASLDPLGTGLSQTEERFKAMISNRELEALGYPGIPTQAALDGVSHRKKGKRGERRPSFRDTGLYSGSFKAWVE